MPQRRSTTDRVDNLLGIGLRCGCVSFFLMILGIAAIVIHFIIKLW